MRQIEYPEDLMVFSFSGAESTTVYGGGIMALENVNNVLEWKVDKECAPYCDDPGYLSLKDISEQLKDTYGIITVFVEEPLGGTVYQWGNYGDEWWKIGDLDGYA